MQTNVTFVMKKYSVVLALFFAMQGFSQNQFEVIKEGNNKILKGVITREDISADSSFTWYKQNLAGYTPNASAVNAFKEKGTDLQVIAFGGTWCSDTQIILPKFFSIIDASAFPVSNVTLIGVDRNKKTIGHLAEALHVLNVPTFIILKNGVEVGRVVEYGKTGQWDKELGDIINSVK